MAGLGWQELVIVLVIIMIIFGAGKLPEVARSLGQGVKEFKTEANQPVGPTSAANTTTTTVDGTTVTADGVVASETTGTRADQV